jgi:hypothetical protein
MRLTQRAAVGFNKREFGILTPAEDVIDLSGYLGALGGDVDELLLRADGLPYRHALFALRMSHEEHSPELAPRWERVELAITTSRLVVGLLSCLGVCCTACAAWYSEGRAARLGARRAWARGHQLYLI